MQMKPRKFYFGWVIELDYSDYKVKPLAGIYYSYSPFLSVADYLAVRTMIFRTRQQAREYKKSAYNGGQMRIKKVRVDITVI
jgi:hypothetical protein